METIKFNTHDYYIKDVAYELKSHPDYIFKQDLDSSITPKKLSDYETPFINLLSINPSIKVFFQSIDTIKQTYTNFNLTMNELVNILLFIQPDKGIDKEIFIMSLNLENFNYSDFNYINIQQKINSFMDEYSMRYNKKKTFRDSNPTQLDGPHITLKTFRISTIDNIQLNDLYNNISVSDIFPFATYHSYLKIHNSFDNNTITHLTDNFKENNTINQIILYYLGNKNKVDDINSYTPIVITYKNKKCYVTMKFDENVWNSIKSSFYNSFNDITFSKEQTISKEGSFFLFNVNINYSILSYICLNLSNDYIIKNERSSLKGGYKLMYDLDDIVLNIKNNNITGSKDEQKIKILTEQEQNTKYLEISFRSKNNKLTNGDILSIKDYVGKLITMYSNVSGDIISLYKNIDNSFDINQDVSNKEIVKTRVVKDIGSILVDTLGADIAKDLKWPRKCPGGKRARQPKVSISPPLLVDIDDDVSDSFKDIIKKDVNNVYYMNWPRDSEYWFSCDHNPAEKYPSPMNQNNYFTPCCFGTLKTTNIKNYLESTTKQLQLQTQIKFDKNTILLNLGIQGINISEDQLDNEESIQISFINEIKELKKQKHILNLDKQSNIAQIDYTRLECISLSLEYLLDTNIIIFDELGTLILPPSTNYIGNIYYNMIYSNTRYFIRKNDKYIEIYPENISNTHKLKLIQNKQLFKINNNNSNFQLPETTIIESQYIDSFGKCRIIKIKNRDIFCQTFIPPLPVKISSSLYNKNSLVSLSNIEDIMKTEDLKILGQYIDNDRCVELMCELYNSKVYCSVNIKPFSKIKKYKNKKIISNTSNVFSTYSKMRNDANKLKKKIIDNPSINDDEINNITSELKVDETERQLVINKLKFFRQLYTSKKSIQKTYIEPISNIVDYKKYPLQRIVNISHPIIPKEYSLGLKDNYNTPNLFINPYFISFKDNIYIVQDTHSIGNACYLQTYWNEFKINYRLNDKKSECSNYTIYDVNGNELVKSGDGTNFIIVINPNQTNQKFMSLLPL